MKILADDRLDAVVFPHQKRLVVPVGETQVERNGALGSVTGFPSIVAPGLFETNPDSQARCSGLHRIPRQTVVGKRVDRDCLQLRTRDQASAPSDNDTAARLSSDKAVEASLTSRWS